MLTSIENTEKKSLQMQKSPLNMNTTVNHLIVRQQEGEPIKIDFLQVKKAAITLRAINHKLRQQIMRLLTRRVSPTQFIDPVDVSL